MIAVQGDLSGILTLKTLHAIGCLDGAYCVFRIVDCAGNHTEIGERRGVAIVVLSDGASGRIGDDHDFEPGFDQRPHV